jgi:hypothetical protein
MRRTLCTCWARFCTSGPTTRPQTWCGVGSGPLPAHSRATQDKLQDLRITHVLNMAKECLNHFEGIPGIDISYLRANLVDNPWEDFYGFIPFGCRFIRESPRSPHTVPLR